MEQALGQRWKRVKALVPDNVRLLAVSKGYKGSDISYLASLGQVWFGESYLQELEAKASQVAGVKWSFIGRLQSRKIKRIIELTNEVQSLSSLKHAKLIAQYAEEFKKAPFPIFLQVNYWNEKSKSGISLQELPDLLDFVQGCRLLEFKGFMMMPPKQERVDYLKLKEWLVPFGQLELSLGMSDDFEEAIHGGVNCLRIGRRIFSSSFAG